MHVLETKVWVGFLQTIAHSLESLKEILSLSSTLSLSESKYRSALSCNVLINKSQFVGQLLSR